MFEDNEHGTSIDVPLLLRHPPLHNCAHVYPPYAALPHQQLLHQPTPPIPPSTFVPAAPWSFAKRTISCVVAGLLARVIAARIKPDITTENEQ